jgi:hypothetical protein
MVLIGAVIMGAVVLAALLGLAIVAFVVLKLRGWWLRRSSRGRGGPDGGGPGSNPGGPAKGIRYIEGEYEVIDPETDPERRPDERR